MANTQCMIRDQLQVMSVGLIAIDGYHHLHSDPAHKSKIGSPSRSNDIIDSIVEHSDWAYEYQD